MEGDGGSEFTTNSSDKRFIVGASSIIDGTSGGVFLFIGYLFDLGEMNATAATFYVLAYLVGGFYKAKEGAVELIRHHSLNVEILMILAAIGAAAIGHWVKVLCLSLFFFLKRRTGDVHVAKKRK